MIKNLKEARDIKAEAGVPGNNSKRGLDPHLI